MTFAPEQLDRSKADLARLLRDLRKRAGLSGDRLARRCGLSQSTISKLETRALGVAPNPGAPSDQLRCRVGEAVLRGPEKGTC
ncbi:helix-turn-helix domain-containing protein [Kitasatospora purpeofusca]|uniref:helix-turn-helix domain-containing protein n=1 Tax=Kitasatospora purpeofusca TaxID=67352 RepID=UPI003253BD86|nr:helix-turn-helix domain-containing protein [Kitasatospora purpeofusca]